MNMALLGGLSALQAGAEQRQAARNGMFGGLSNPQQQLDQALGGSLQQQFGGAFSPPVFRQFSMKEVLKPVVQKVVRFIDELRTEIDDWVSFN